MKLGSVALLVPDFDEAIAYYVDKLGCFTVVSDTSFKDRRWVMIQPAGSPDGAPSLVLQQAASEEQKALVGKQGGGRTFLYLETDDFDRDAKKFTEAGVEWVTQREEKPHGITALWRDVFGNQWDLIQRST